MIIKPDAHAEIRAKERGTNKEEICVAINEGEKFPAKHGRSGFRKNFVYKAMWCDKYYENKQIEVFAAESDSGWVVVTVIVKYF